MGRDQPISDMSSAPLLYLSARVGVLLYDNTVEVDTILAASVRGIREHGIAVAGLLQNFGDRLPNGKRSMWVRDIGTGRPFVSTGVSMLDHQCS